MRPQAISGRKKNVPKTTEASCKRLNLDHYLKRLESFRNHVRLLKNPWRLGIGADAAFYCCEAWSTEILLPLSTTTVLLLPFLGPNAGRPTWAWGVGGFCARNRTKCFMF